MSMICPTCDIAMNKVSAHEEDPLFICPKCNKQQIRMVEKQVYVVPKTVMLDHEQRKFEFKNCRKFFPVAIVFMLIAYVMFFHASLFEPPQKDIPKNILNCCAISFFAFLTLAYYYDSWRFSYSFLASAATWTAVYISMATYVLMFGTKDEIANTNAVTWMQGYGVVGTISFVGNMAGRGLRMIRKQMMPKWYDIETVE